MKQDFSELKILVCCHKPSPVPHSGVLLPIHVGAEISSVKLGIQKDNEVKGLPCDNISAKNPNYCELTALYWAWKNIRTIHPDIQYIGLNHYRRYFAFNETRSTGNAISKDVQSIESYKLDIPKLKKWLTQGKIIIPPKAYLKSSVASSYEHAHFSEDLRVVHNVVKKIYPDYLDDFNILFLCKNFFYDCNMFIMPIAEFENYCEWLFNILFAVEKEVDIRNYNNYQKRIFGFLSERLFTLWILHKKYKVKNLNYFVYTDNSSIQRKGFIEAIRCRMKIIKQNLGFFISRPRNKNFFERYWIVP